MNTGSFLIQSYLLKFNQTKTIGAMKFKVPYLVLFFTSVLMSSLSLQAQNVVEQIQVIPGELPDPSIIEVDGTYYATGTSGDWAPIYPIYTSTDLKNWELLSHVFLDLPDWAMSSFWAPELYFKDGTFFCYYTARAKDGISKIGVATTKDISQGFQDKGVIIEWGNEAIDAFVYEHQNSLYITWKAYGLEPSKPVTLLGSKLSDDGLSLIGKEFVTITADDNEFEGNMIEGQCIVEKGGYLYMIYSGNGCCGPQCNYQVGVARAKNMKGPWEKAPENPLIVGNSSWKCPGHGTVIYTKNKWYYLYHAYNSKGFPSLGRAAIFSEMYWDENNGWPYFKVNEETSEKDRLVKNLIDNFEQPQLNNFWRKNLLSTDFDIELVNGELELTETHPDSKNKTGAALCVIPDDSDFEFSIKVKNTNQALKGLVFYTTKDKSLGLGIQGNELLLWKVTDGNFEVMESTQLKNAQNIALKAKVSDSNKIDFSYQEADGNWKSFNTLQGNNLTWWSSGMKIGIQIKKDIATGAADGRFDDFMIQYK
ncbi:beta-xylosidase [Muricauda sp. NBRC 101325]|nr:beta-xylosidase [Muricauda sp. NBRC 101325]